MNRARAGACVAALDDSLLYVMGGRSAINDYTAPNTLDVIECFDPQTDMWTFMGIMLVSRCEAGTAVL